MSGERKFLIGIAVVTLLIIGVGVFFFGSQKPKVLAEKVDVGGLIAEAKHTKGDLNAKVKIVEFGDYQCPACGAAYPIVKQILEKNTDKLYFVFRNYPLPSHPNANIAAKAAESAGLQGKFWEMNGMLYENQSEWSGEGDPKGKFSEYAKKIGIDEKKFVEDLDGTIGTINSDYNLGNKFGVESTPTFFVNGTRYSGVLNMDKFQEIIDAESK